MNIPQEMLNGLYLSLRETDLGEVERLVACGLEQNIPPRVILKEGLIGAMNLIGREFKAGEIWVPDVLLAARNMNRGIEMLKAGLSDNEITARGKLVIGTVKGDIHDIGKNLVGMMMTGAGFQVIDLGTDVPKARFLEAVDREKPDLVGLSALLTTTMLEMKAIIATVRETFPDPPKIIVGGAPVTERFASEIGADGYSADAVLAVSLADRLLSSRRG